MENSWEKKIDDNWPKHAKQSFYPRENLQHWLLSSCFKDKAWTLKYDDN